jgi:hypothetical protein
MRAVAALRLGESVALCARLPLCGSVDRLRLRRSVFDSTTLRPSQVALRKLKLLVIQLAPLSVAAAPLGVSVLLFYRTTETLYY